MRKILIAEDAEEICQALTEALQQQFQVRVCRDGATALELLSSYQPDILVLELMLPRLDGLTLLEMAGKQGIRPLTIATTLMVNDYVTASLERLHVDYLMAKPCDLCAMTLRITDLAERLTDQPPAPREPRSRISEMLMELGIPTRLKGFACLEEAVALMAQDFTQSVTKELYPAVGQLFGTSGAQVERAIRNAIEIGWKQHDGAAWKHYFGIRPNGTVPKPTNSEFISRLAHELQP